MSSHRRPNQFGVRPLLIRMSSGGFLPNITNRYQLKVVHPANVHRSCEGQLVESRLISMRIGRFANVLGTGRDGPIHTQNHRVWNSGWRRRWHGALPDVQAGHSSCKPSEISEFRSWSVVSISSMGCQPQNPWCHGNQNRPLFPGLILSSSD